MRGKGYFGKIYDPVVKSGWARKYRGQSVERLTLKRDKPTLIFIRDIYMVYIEGNNKPGGRNRFIIRRSISPGGNNQMRGYRLVKMIINMLHCFSHNLQGL